MPPASTSETAVTITVAVPITAAQRMAAVQVELGEEGNSVFHRFDREIPQRAG